MLNIVEKTKRRMRLKVWSTAGRLTSLLAQFDLPEWMQTEVYKAHVAIYYRWVDARGTTKAKCATCTQPIELPANYDERIPVFCSAECSMKMPRGES